MTASAIDQATRLRSLFAEEPTVPSSEAPAAVSLAPVPVGPAQPMLTIASGKGGVGKTTLAVNIAISLARLGCRPTLLDADIGTANADVLCGINPNRRLDAVLSRSPQARHTPTVAIEAPGGFTLVPGAVGLTRLASLDAARRDAVLQELTRLETLTDLFLIDAGAGVGPDVQLFVEASDATILVVTPEPTSIADAYALIKSVHLREAASRSAGTPSLAGGEGSLTPRWWVVVNQARHEAQARAAYNRLAVCAQRFLGIRAPMLGWLHADKRVAQAVRTRSPFALSARTSRPAREVQTLARSVLKLGQCMNAAPSQAL